MNKKTGTYLFIMAVAGAEIIALAFHADRLTDAPLWFWALVGFATLRAARTISFNGIAAPLRAPFTLTEPDGSGAGDTVNPRPGDTVRAAIGELIACPICTGTHAAALMLLAYSISPGLGLAAVAVFGVAGISEVLHWAACLLEWKGNEAREATGKMVREREAHARVKKQLEELSKRLRADLDKAAHRPDWSGSYNWRADFGVDRSGWRSDLTHFTHLWADPDDEGDK